MPRHEVHGMTAWAIVDEVLRASQIAIQGLLLFLLWRRSLFVRYRAFACLIAAQLCRSALLAPLSPTSILYSAVWAVTQPILWAATLLALLEVMQLVFEQYPRLGAFSTRITSSSFIVGVLMGLGFALIDLGNVRMPFWLDACWTISQAVSWATCFIVVAQMVWFWIFPIAMVPNVVLHRILFSLYAGVIPGMALLLAATGSRRSGQLTNEIYLFADIALLLCWCCLLTQSREYCPLPLARTQQTAAGDDPRSWKLRERLYALVR